MNRRIGECGDFAVCLIVGFSTSQTEGDYNYTIVTPVFVDVADTDNAKLSSLNFEPMDDDSIQMFTSDGELGDQLFYMTKKVEGKWTTAWFLNGETLANDYVFPAGQAFWTCMGVEGTVKFPALQLAK